MTSTAVLVCALLLVCSYVAADTPEKQTSHSTLSSPDVLVLVWIGDGWVDLVSINYNSEVNNDVVNKDIAAFTESLGWNVDNLSITTKRIPVPGAKLTTSAAFETKTQGASIVIDPIVLAFKRFDNIQISYLSGADSVFFAPSGFQDANIAVALTQNPGTYQYKINVKNHDLRRLNWPKEKTADLRNTENKDRTGFATIVIIAAFCSVAVYYITKHLWARQ